MFYAKDEELPLSQVRRICRKLLSESKRHRVDAVLSSSVTVYCSYDPTLNTADRGKDPLIIIYSTTHGNDEGPSNFLQVLLVKGDGLQVELHLQERPNFDGDLTLT